MMKTQQWLGVIVLLQTLILVSVWSGRPTYESAAQAQVQMPNPGAQRIEMVEQLQALNARVEALSSFIKSGQMRVHIVTGEGAPDEQK